MRRHFYLVVEAPDEDVVGGVDIREQRYAAAKKNEQRTIQKRDLDSNEQFTETVVSLGYHDFDGEQDYRDRNWVVTLEKLQEIDQQHLEDAGLDPEMVARKLAQAREEDQEVATDGGTPTATRHGKSPAQRIAGDQLDMLAEKPARCAWVSVRVGRHPWVCYSADLGTYVITETGGTGRLEVDTATKSGLINLFAENPVDIKPKEAAEFSPNEPGRANVWEYAAEGGENVVYADERLAGGDA